MTQVELRRAARDINAISEFTAVRDVGELAPSAIGDLTGNSQVDALVLFGGAPLCGADVFAGAMRAGLARTCVIVGGAGHTTPAFREKTRALCPDVRFSDDASEAEVFEAYLEARHGLCADFLERFSTNCGSNVVNLRKLLGEKGIECESMAFIHDASMQRRMSAQIEKEMPTVRRVNFAAYRTTVEANGQGRGTAGLSFVDAPFGMWDMDHYLSLLMGEIPRLSDDEGGYGPRGSGFIAHVNIPCEVRSAWERLRAVFPEHVRRANPLYASPGARRQEGWLLPLVQERRTTC